MIKILLILLLMPSIVFGQITKSSIETVSDGTTTCNPTKLVFSSITSCTNKVATIASGGSTISGLTTNYLTKATSSSTIANSRSLDDGTNFIYGTNLSTTALDEQTFHNSSALSVNYVPSGILGIDSYVKLMQHLNNSGVDSSFLANTMTNNGSIAFTSTSPPFSGTYWAVFNGAGTKSFTTPTSSSFDLGSSDATFDFKFQPNTHIADANFISQGTDGNNFYSVQYSVGGPGNRIQFYYVTGGVIGYRAYALWTPVDGTSYHIAVQFSGSTLAIFVDGTSQSIVTATGSRPTFPHYTGLLKVGTQVFAANDPDGQLAEMRFSVGIARYSGNFTPNTTPYTSTASTPTLKMYGNGSLLGYISIANATNIMSIVNNGVTAQSIGSTGITTFGNDITTSTHNIVTDTSTGTSFGSGTTQKTSAYGVTPVVQGGATTDLGTILSNWGLRATGTAYPITTSGATNLSGSNTINGYATTAKAVSFLSYQPGLLTAVNATIGVYAKVSNASTVDNIIGSAVTFSCVANPTITMYECGTSATCASSPVTIGTVTVTAAGTAATGTVSNPAITAGDYIGFAMTAGTCASIDISANAQIHSN